MCDTTAGEGEVIVSPHSAAAAAAAAAGVRSASAATTWTSTRSTLPGGTSTPDAPAGVMTGGGGGGGEEDDDEHVEEAKEKGELEKDEEKDELEDIVLCFSAFSFFASPGERAGWWSVAAYQWRRWYCCLKGVSAIACARLGRYTNAKDDHHHDASLSPSPAAEEG